ncbi:formylglycine-generating enzyme family protein [Paenibacillus faecis]|uniref:formylglycine-generating enzyme family protein n=1 Tax=Paenibacillus faecis TaxID=862114 RepID=UPI001BCC5BF8|nr:SUMF1/EgtB/PvdO family nonheme iron enzyme [Paenibacillus faecis]
MALIPKGEVQLRDDRIQRRWNVEVESFLLASYPVTQALYRAVVGGPPVDAASSQKPMVNISWHEAVSFCNMMSRAAGLSECYSFGEDGETVDCDWTAEGYRLPTEAEWQYACKAGTTGYQYDELDRIAWYSENSQGAPHEVGQKNPNPWGLYDMLGNVWEWCWDIYDKEVYGTYRIFRGGSWAEEARGCGATCRRRSHPTFKIDDLGFRLARPAVKRC